MYIEYAATHEDLHADRVAAAEQKAQERAVRSACDADRNLDPRDRLASRAAMLADAYGVNPHTGEPYYTAVDVLTWVARVIEHECAMPQLGPATIIDAMRLKAIPNAPFRERYLTLKEEGQVTAADLALRIGETRIKTKGDTERVGDASRVERLLGIAKDTPSGHENALPRLRMFVSYEIAVRLADALGLSYHEVGV